MSTKNPITTHILDTSSGKPAAAIPVKLYRLQGQDWQLLSSANSNEDGRISDWDNKKWYANKTAESLYSTYKLLFNLDVYWQNQAEPAFYPSAEIVFRLQDTRHHHIPLLLSAFGYSTYRGS